LSCVGIDKLFRHLRSQIVTSSIDESAGFDDVIFNHISANAESNQKVFFDGQIYDAFSFIVELIEKASVDIKLIDNYVDIGTTKSA
jgi:hypothetical protein